MKSNKKDNDKLFKQMVIIAIHSNKQETKTTMREALDAIEQLTQNQRVNAAVSVLKQLVPQEKGQLAFLTLAQLLLRQCWYPELHELLYSEHAPKKPSASIAILRGVCALKLLDIKLALAQFKLSLKLEPNSFYATHNIALCYSAIGDKEKTIHYFNKTIKINNQHFDSYILLAKILPPEQYEKFNDSVQALLEYKQLNNVERAKLCFALSYLAEKMSDNKQEMDYLDQANQLIFKGATVNFTEMRTAQENMVDRFVDWFKSQNNAPLNNKIENVTPIFICSLPRSGSSLLEKLLNENTHVSATGESATFFSALRQLSSSTAESPTTLLEPSAIEHHRKNLLQCHRNILDLYQTKTGFYTDKTLDNFLDVGRILQLYPQAKIIWLNRDPRDICISCYQYLFENGNGNEYIYSLAETAKHILHFENCMSKWHAQFPNSIIQVNYENLVDNTHQQMESLRSFINIPTDEPTTETDNSGTDNKATVLTMSTWQVRSAINNKAIGKWRHYEKHLAEACKILGTRS